MWLIIDAHRTHHAECDTPMNERLESSGSIFSVYKTDSVQCPGCTHRKKSGDLDQVTTAPLRSCFYCCRRFVVRWLLGGCWGAGLYGE